MSSIEQPSTAWKPEIHLRERRDGPNLCGAALDRPFTLIKGQEACEKCTWVAAGRGVSKTPAPSP